MANNKGAKGGGSKRVRGPKTLWYEKTIRNQCSPTLEKHEKREVHHDIKVTHSKPHQMSVWWSVWEQKALQIYWPVLLWNGVRKVSSEPVHLLFKKPFAFPIQTWAICLPSVKWLSTTLQKQSIHNPNLRASLCTSSLPCAQKRMRSDTTNFSGKHWKSLPLVHEQHFTQNNMADKVKFLQHWSHVALSDLLDVDSDRIYMITIKR